METLPTLPQITASHAADYLNRLSHKDVAFNGVRYASAVAAQFEPTAEHLRDFYKALNDAPRELLGQGTPWPTLSDCLSPEYCNDGQWVQSDYGANHLYVGSVWHPNGDLRWYVYVIGYTKETFSEAYLVSVIQIRPPYLD